MEQVAHPWRFLELSFTKYSPSSLRITDGKGRIIILSLVL
jgi:hypothetical protein